MRNISKTASFLFLDRIAKKAGNNTAITRQAETNKPDTYYMELHGNKIACLQAFEDGYNVKRNRAIHITLAGWNTTTTRERLNALLKILGKANLHIVQHKGKACLATFSGNKRLTTEINPYEWYDITQLEHMANYLVHKHTNAA